MAARSSTTVMTCYAGSASQFSKDPRWLRDVEDNSGSPSWQDGKGLGPDYVSLLMRDTMPVHMFRRQLPNRLVVCTTAPPKAGEQVEVFRVSGVEIAEDGRPVVLNFDEHGIQTLYVGKTFIAKCWTIKRLTPGVFSALADQSRNEGRYLEHFRTKALEIEVAELRRRLSAAEGAGVLDRDRRGAGRQDREDREDRQDRQDSAFCAWVERGEF